MIDETRSVTGFPVDDVMRRLATPPRTLEELQALEPRDHRHEEAPFIPKPELSISEKLAEQAIAPLRQAGQHVLDQFRPMHDRLDKAEQMVIAAMSEIEAFVHAKMRIINAAAKINQDIDRELKEAMEPLKALMEGRQ